MPLELVVPTFDILVYINIFTTWLSENVTMLFTVAGVIGLVSWGFMKARQFLFG